MIKNEIPVIIPSYEPDDRLLKLCEELKTEGVNDVILVDDGSFGEGYQKIFQTIEQKFQFTVLHHAVNLGKGRALKTAFNECLLKDKGLMGCVTADSDGQHTVKDILACRRALEKNPEELILGCRDFDRGGIPGRSVFGNKCTSFFMKLLTGIHLSDTQTGLRALPASFMRQLMNEKGERFEFETNMLLAAKMQDMKITEVSIQTIYMENNKTSHFHPLKDSLKIYAVLLKFVCASLSSSVLDLFLFTVFCMVFSRLKKTAFDYIMLATICARILSATFNFLMNYKVVFRSGANKATAVAKYTVLAVCIMLASGFLVSHLHTMMGGAEVLIKIPVDMILFLVSFLVQREFVYK